MRDPPPRRPLGVQHIRTPKCCRYRDADANYFVPLPTRGEEVEKDSMLDRCVRSGAGPASVPAAPLPWCTVVAACVQEPPPKRAHLVRSAANDMWRVVLNLEVNSFHWTLMHRFHKAADIINEARGV